MFETQTATARRTNSVLWVGGGYKLIYNNWRHGEFSQNRSNGYVFEFSRIKP